MQACRSNTCFKTLCLPSCIVSSSCCLSHSLEYKPLSVLVLDSVMIFDSVLALASIVTYFCWQATINAPHQCTSAAPHQCTSSMYLINVPQEVLGAPQAVMILLFVFQICSESMSTCVGYLMEGARLRTPMMH